MEEFSVFEVDFQADAPDPNSDQRGIKRPLSEAQRKAKIERDRSRRQEHRVEFHRLRNVEVQYNQIAPQMEVLQNQVLIGANIISELKEKNKRLNTKIQELENALLERTAPDYLTRNKNLLLHSHGNQPQMSLIGGENQVVWNTTVRPRAPLMPDLCFTASVQTQVVAAMPPESVIDKETVTNQFTMKVPFLFVASKTEDVTCIRLRGKCSASPDQGGLIQYLFEWIPHHTSQESWENLGWSPMDDVGLFQNLAPPRGRRCGGQANFPIKFLLWNSVGPLNSYRQRVVLDLTNHLQPAVLVLTETRLTRARAEEIIGTFPFDVHRVTPNLGFVGGMWLLWRSEVVEVELLSFTEHEIHALIKEPQTNPIPNPWEFFGDMMNSDSLEETPSFLAASHPNEQIANSEPVTEAQGSTAVNMAYADELVADFMVKLDAKYKNRVDFSDFKGLIEELKTTGIEHLPPSLAPIHERIQRVYGDITADSRLSACIVRTCYILLCSVIKEMDELKLDQIDQKKMLFWRDAVNSCLSNEIHCNFAIDHLKNIARAYYGLKAWNNRGNDEKELESIQQRISELNIELESLEEKHAKKLEEQNSEVRKLCIHVAQQFLGKPLSTFLFIPP
ncbi:hypothetical protein PTKIN_Ptkin04bG0170600 [Pterospermum kingtungense]